MKFLWAIMAFLTTCISCSDDKSEYMRRKIYTELNYSLTNFTICDEHKSGITLGSDYDEQIVLKLDSIDFFAISKRMYLATTHQDDSLLWYDRTIGPMEYVTIQLNKNQRTLTYTYWSD